MCFGARKPNASPRGAMNVRPVKADQPGLKQCRVLAPKAQQRKHNFGGSGYTSTGAWDSYVGDGGGLGCSGDGGGGYGGGGDGGGGGCDGG
ncbi:hypothetical protein HJFPF1_05867 [Paramyrothecium foliicola]|nr:hypothetical protein HJFPF1_05867 [Paramyrothecium foliicola]